MEIKRTIIFVKELKMQNNNIYDNIFEKQCAVCGHTYLADIYEQGECKNCGWYNGFIYRENPDSVVFSNIISLNKAKRYFKEGKPFIPDLNDFLAMFDCYGEVCFEYKRVEYGLYKHKENLEMSWGPEPCGTVYFKHKEDFIQNAKIGDEFVRDIWDKVEDPRYL